MIYELLIPRDPTEFPELPRGAAILASGLALVAIAPGRVRCSYADLCRAAVRSGRPLEARPEQLLRIGHWDQRRGEVILQPAGVRPLAGWLGHSPHRNDLEASDSEDNARTEARQDFRRALMQGNTARAAAISARHGIHHW